MTKPLFPRAEGLESRIRSAYAHHRHGEQRPDLPEISILWLGVADMPTLPLTRRKHRMNRSDCACFGSADCKPASIRASTDTPPSSWRVSRTYAGSAFRFQAAAMLEILSTRLPRQSAQTGRIHRGHGPQHLHPLDVSSVALSSLELLIRIVKPMPLQAAQTRQPQNGGMKERKSRSRQQKEPSLTTFLSRSLLLNHSPQPLPEPLHPLPQLAVPALLLPAPALALVVQAERDPVAPPRRVPPQVRRHAVARGAAVLVLLSHRGETRGSCAEAECGR